MREAQMAISHRCVAHRGAMTVGSSGQVVSLTSFIPSQSDV